MVTTFTSRELVRDELATLFSATTTWENVYGYFPAASEITGQTPLLVILSDGTRQAFSNQDNNTVSYQFIILNFVLATGVATASDEIDDLDRAIRQTIRNNTQLATANNLRFADGFSKRRDVNVGGKPYMTEEYTIIADLARGAI